jgi:uncharacterized protein YukE
MATKLGVAVTTIQGWKERGHIPAGRWQQIAAAAAAHGIDLDGGADTPVQAEETPEALPDKPLSPKTPQRPDPVRERKKFGPAVPRPGTGETAAAPAKPATRKEPPPQAGPSDKGMPVRKSGAGVAWLAVGLTVALAAGLLTRPYWEPVIHRSGPAGQGGADPAALEGLAADLTTVEATVRQLDRDIRTRNDAMAGRIGALEAGGGEAGEAYAGQLADLEARMADLSRSLSTLSGSLSRMEDRLSTLEPLQSELGKINARLDDLQSGMTTRDESFRAQDTVLTEGLTVVGSKLAGLESRLSELEVRPIQTGEKIAALALAIGQVEAALNSGRPYRSALDRLYALGRDDPLITDGAAVAVLSPWADHGIPDRLALHRRFVEITPQIDRALAGIEEETWLDSVWNSVKGLVTIRRIDGDGDLSPVSRAEIAMERGDLAATAATFEDAGSLGVEGDVWLNHVRARLAAETEIEALYGLVIAPLAGTAGAGANTQ